MVDGDGSGGQSPSRQGARTGTSDPKTEFRMAAEHGGVFAIMTIRPRVYTTGALYGPKEGCAPSGPLWAH